MSEEANLLGELRRIHEEYERLNGRIRLATQRRQYSPVELEQKNAAEEVSKLLREIDRLMTRMRAIEGNLKEIREKGRRRFQ
jgi:predicted  nucleic acid-binding Zn-ribbon protein